MNTKRENIKEINQKIHQRTCYKGRFHGRHKRKSRLFSFLNFLKKKKFENKRMHFDRILEKSNSKVEHHHPHKISLPNYILIPLSIFIRFCISFFPIIQFTSWITSFVIACKNKGKFHYFHSIHGVSRLITISIQIFAILILFIVDVGLKLQQKKGIMRRKIPMLGLLVFSGLLIFSCVLYLKRGLQAKKKIH